MCVRVCVYESVAGCTRLPVCLLTLELWKSCGFGDWKSISWGSTRVSMNLCQNCDTYEFVPEL